jgi:hypothetical protein
MFRGIPISEGEVEEVFGVLFIEDANLIGTGVETELTTDAFFIVLRYYAVLALCNRVCRTDCKAGRSIAVLAAHRIIGSLEIVRIRASSGIKIGTAIGSYLVVPDAIGQVVIRFACDTAGMAAYASVQVDSHS